MPLSSALAERTRLRVRGSVEVEGRPSGAVKTNARCVWHSLTAEAYAAFLEGVWRGEREEWAEALAKARERRARSHDE